MRCLRTIALIVAVALAGGATAADEAANDTLRNSLTNAAGGQQAFTEYGLLNIVLNEDETTAEGKTHTKTYTIVLNTADPARMRMEMEPRIVMGRNGTDAWAMIRGQIDDRRQTPMMARGTMNQKAFPALIPFSLAFPAVELGETQTVTWQGSEVESVEITFPPQFFASPVMNTTWYALVDPETNLVKAVEYRPPAQYVEAGAEGVRYIVQGYEEVDGFRLPKGLFVEGLSPNGQPNGHTRSVDIQYSRDTRVPARLFMNPEKLEAFESGDVPQL